ncbi:head maturation protease, ClpP-related [Tepidimicrobium xylanilyticum]
MPKKINIKGEIIPNDYKWIYDLFDIENTSPGDVEKALKEANGEDIEVIINSPGGDVFSGSEIYTLLKEYKGKSVGKIVGIAASAASVIAMGVDKLYISPTAEIMIHNVQSQARGDYRDFEHEAGVLKDYNSTIANAYLLKTGMSKEELLDLMDNETWLTPQQALEKGFVDEIMFNDGKIRLTASIKQSTLPINVINKMRSLKVKGLLNLKDNQEPNDNPPDSQQGKEADILLAKLILLKLKGEIDNE